MSHISNSKVQINTIINSLSNISPTYTLLHREPWINQHLHEHYGSNSLSRRPNKDMFFLDPSQWLDCRAEKVTKHQSSQSSLVNGAVIALVGVHFWCSLVVVILPWCDRNSFQVLCTGGIVVVGWRR